MCSLDGLKLGYDFGFFARVSIGMVLQRCAMGQHGLVE